MGSSSTFTVIDNLDGLAITNKESTSKRSNEESIELFKQVIKVGESMWESMGNCNLFTSVMVNDFYFICIQPNDMKQGDQNHKRGGWLLHEQIMPYSSLTSFEDCQQNFDFTTKGLELSKTNLDEYLLWKVDTTSSNYFLLHFKSSENAMNYQKDGFNKFKSFMNTKLKTWQAEFEGKDQVNKITNQSINKFWDTVAKRSAHCQSFGLQMEELNDKEIVLKNAREKFENDDKGPDFKMFQKVSLCAKGQEPFLKSEEQEKFQESVGAEAKFFIYDDDDKEISQIDFGIGIFTLHENTNNFASVVRFFDIYNRKILLQCPLKVFPVEQFNYSIEGMIEWFSNDVAIDRQIAMKNERFYEDPGNLMYHGKIQIQFPSDDQHIVDNVVKVFQATE